MYDIKIQYTTGDSYSTEECQKYIGITWRDLEYAKKSLGRIKEHYLWYDYQYSYFRTGEQPKKPDWHNNRYDNSIKLLTDNGVEVEINAFWCGYFETLNSVEIVEKDSSLKWIVNEY